MSAFIRANAVKSSLWEHLCYSQKIPTAQQCPSSKFFVDQTRKDIGDTRDHIVWQFKREQGTEVHLANLAACSMLDDLREKVDYRSLSR